MTIAAETTLAPPSRADLGSRVVLRAEGLRKAFGGQVVLDGVDLELREGEVVLLRGENGSGKTTLLNLLTGNLEPDSGGIEYLAYETPRSYRFPRRWWQDLNPWDHFRPEFVAREGIGRTWQDVRLFGAQTLRDNIAVAEPGHPGENPLVALFAPGRGEGRERELNREADRMLERLGLGGREESSADKISLGQSKRVAIARAVAAGARILFLDEPLAGLDRQGIKDVLEFLKSLVRDHSLTLVIVEHVFNFVHLHDLVSVHWMLERGQIRADRAEPSPQVDSIDGIPVMIAPPAWFSQLVGNPDQMSCELLPRGATLTRIRRSDRWRPEAKPVLEIKGLIVKRGQRTVVGLDEQGEPIGFDLALSEGEIAILQAPNGWGKSTLFDAICGNALTVDGSVVLNGSPVEFLPTWGRAQTGLAASPSAATLFPSLQVSEVARLALRSNSIDPGTMPFAQRTISGLSGGEKQRTLLRLALPNSESPHLVLLDEPFAMLDDYATLQAVEALTGTRPSHAILLFLPANHSFN